MCDEMIDKMEKAKTGQRACTRGRPTGAMRKDYDMIIYVNLRKYQCERLG